jgi:hypothetical protein
MGTNCFSNFQIFPHFHKGRLTHIETPAGTIMRDLSSGPPKGNETWMATYNGIEYRAAEVANVVEWLADEYLKAKFNQQSKLFGPR